MAIFQILWLVMTGWILYSGIKAIISRKTWLYYRAFFKSGRIELEGTPAIALGVFEIIGGMFILYIFFKFIINIQ